MGIIGRLISPKALYLAGRVEKIEAEIGYSVITNEGPVWHSGFITAETREKIYIEEANHTPKKITSRWLDKDDQRIVGYFTGK